MTELVFPSLADNVVHLRRWRRADTAAMLAAFADPVFVQHSDWQPRNERQTAAYLQENELARERGNQIGFAIAEPNDRERVLGGISLNDVDRHHARASVGYWLTPNARGRGVATHAVNLVVGWALDYVGIARLELTCGPDNLASQRVALRCGFKREGLLRSHMAFKTGRRDTVVFSILPGEHERHDPTHGTDT